MKNLKNLILSIFGFSNKETNGFVLLSIFLILLFFISITIRYWQPGISNSHAKDQHLLDSLMSILNYSSHLTYKNSITKTQKQLHPFNPNTDTPEKLMALGIDKQLAYRIIKYRDKVKKFTTKKDIQKVYGVNDSIYSVLSPFIQLPEYISIEKKYRTLHTTTPEKKHSTVLLIDINTADTTLLKTIYGIGSKRAQRIISYRDKLGGFIHKIQYHEIVGLDSVTLLKLEASTEIRENFKPHYIFINQDNFEKLKSHPYINYKIAKLIINYRNQHGRFSSIDDIKNIKIISDSTIKKMIPYLRLD